MSLAIMAVVWFAGMITALLLLGAWGLLLIPVIFVVGVAAGGRVT